MDHLGDGVQGIEEEVRLELHAEQLQPRLGEARLEVLALAAAPVVLDPVGGGDDRAVDHEVERQRADQPVHPEAGEQREEDAIRGGLDERR